MLDRLRHTEFRSLLGPRRSQCALAAARRLLRVSCPFHGRGRQSNDPDPQLRRRYDTPETVVDSGPPPTSADPNPVFVFSSPDAASYECQLDGGGYSPCSSPKSYSGVSEGPHTFEVRGVDSAGNRDSSSATASFVVKQDPPPEPEQGETTNLDPIEGEVTVDIPGDGLGPIPIQHAVQVPVGTIVDTRNGRVALTSDAKGRDTRTRRVLRRRLPDPPGGTRR